MGSSTYSSSVFDSTMRSYRAAGTSAFTYTDDVSSGKAARVVHPSLDPKLVAGPKSPYAGKVMRESRDSDAHPESLAIAVLFDVTGSMGSGPRMFIEKLGALMNLLVKKGYVEHPQILYGAVGDETSDYVPLQIGQFEAGNEQEASLSNIFIEGNGGSQHYESYELAMYFMARHTSMDCLEKRGDKGILFIVGDECFRDKVSAGAINRIIGDSVQDDIPTATVLAELREKFEVIWLFPNCSSYYNLTLTADPLKAEFGQNFIRLDNVGDIAEVIAATIGVHRGYNPKDIRKDLIAGGLDKDAASRATTAITTYAASSSAVVKKSATVEGALATSGGDDTVTRL